jgi:hypothetical protein
MFPQDDIGAMSPDDLAALMEIAGPLYGASRALEQDTIAAGKNDGQRVGGSEQIRNGLEQAESIVQAQARQHYIQQNPYPVQPPQQGVPFQQQYYIPPVPQPAPVDNGQLEFSFDPKGMDITNDLLKEISVKLTKILVALEKGATVPKKDGKSQT